MDEYQVDVSDEGGVFYTYTLKAHSLDEAKRKAKAKLADDPYASSYRVHVSKVENLEFY